MVVQIHATHLDLVPSSSSKIPTFQEDKSKENHSTGPQNSVSTFHPSVNISTEYLYQVYIGAYMEGRSYVAQWLIKLKSRMALEGPTLQSHQGRYMISYHFKFFLNRGNIPLRDIVVFLSSVIRLQPGTAPMTSFLGDKVN